MEGRPTLSAEEVQSQVRICSSSKFFLKIDAFRQILTLMIAGYETTSSKLCSYIDTPCNATIGWFSSSHFGLCSSQTKYGIFDDYFTQWALIELTRHPAKQAKLREELLQFPNDPTYDQMNNSLPYLEAVFREVLRLHPSQESISRVVSAGS